MKSLKFIVLPVFIIVVTGGCGSKVEEGNIDLSVAKVNTPKTIQYNEPIVKAGNPTASTVDEKEVVNPPPSMNGMAALKQAAEEGKYSFSFFYRQMNEQTSALSKVFEKATKKVVDRADAIMIKVSDPKEKEIVDKFNAKRLPMPFVLVMAPNGAVTGSFAMKFSEKELLDSFAGPCTEKCFKELQEGKLVILSLQNDKTSSNEAAMKGVLDFKADPKYTKTTTIITMDPADPAESKFLKQIRVQPKQDEAMTVVLAPPGKVAGQIKGATAKGKLVALFNSSCGTGCGPGG